MEGERRSLHLFHTFYLTGADTENLREGEDIHTDHLQTLTQLEALKEKQMVRSVK